MTKNISIFQKSAQVVEIGNDALKILGRSRKLRPGAKWRFFARHKAEITEPLPIVIDRAFRDMDLPRKGIVLCLPRHLIATTRILKLPSADPREIQNMLNLQVGKHTPYAREEVVASHNIISSDTDGYTKVMLVIARNDVIRENWRVIREAGLKVDKVVLSSEGAFRSFMSAAELREEAAAIVDIDSGYSDFIAASGGRMAFVRPILIGARHAAEEPQTWMNKFTEELKHSIELYRQGGGSDELKHLSFTGAHCLDHQQVERIGTELAVNTSILPSPEADELMTPEQRSMFSLSPLSGAARHQSDFDIDLTSSALRVDSTMERKRKNVTVTGILLISIMMAVSVLIMLSLYNRQLYLERLQSQRYQLQKESSRVERMRRDIELIRRRLDAEGATLNLLREIYVLTPSEIYFSDIQVEKKSNVILKGQALAMSHVFRFVTTLEASPLFENVQATRTTSRQHGDEERYEFEIVCAYGGK